jgi:hypothetical protein
MFPNFPEKGFLLALSIGLILLTPNTRADTVKVFSQSVSPIGGLYQSSRWDPDGSDYDQYVWDDFTFQSTTSISAIGWVGGYDPVKSGSGGKVLDFIVKIYPSIAAGTQPDVAHNALFEYHSNGNANESVADSLVGVRYYAYSFVLPTLFEAVAKTKYWIQIEAMQHGIPDWGIAAATNGDGTYFRRIANVGDIYYQAIQGDAAFFLVGQSVPTKAGRASKDRKRQSSSVADYVLSLFIANVPVSHPTGSSVSIRDVLGRKIIVTTIDRSSHSFGASRLSNGAFVAVFAGKDERK